MSQRSTEHDQMRMMKRQDFPFKFYDAKIKYNHQFRYPSDPAEQKIMKEIFQDSDKTKNYVVYGKHHVKEDSLNYSCFTIHIRDNIYPIYTHILAHANSSDLESAIHELLYRLGIQWDIHPNVSYTLLSQTSDANAQIYYAPVSGSGYSTRDVLEDKYQFYFCDKASEKWGLNKQPEEKNKGRLTSLCLHMNYAWSACFHELAVFPEAIVNRALEILSEKRPLQ